MAVSIKSNLDLDFLIAPHVHNTFYCFCAKAFKFLRFKTSQCDFVYFYSTKSCLNHKY